MKIEQATAVKASMGELNLLITADDKLQREIAIEIAELSERARVSRASAAAARAKRDGNIKLLYDLQVSLEASLSA